MGFRVWDFGLKVRAFGFLAVLGSGLRVGV